MIVWTSRLYESPSTQKQLSALIREIDPYNDGLWSVIFRRLTEDSYDIDSVILSLRKLAEYRVPAAWLTQPILQISPKSPVDTMILHIVQQKWYERQREVTNHTIATLEWEMKKRAFSVGSMMGISAIAGAAGFSLGRCIEQNFQTIENIPAQEEKLTDEQVKILRQQRELFIQQNREIEVSAEK